MKIYCTGYTIYQDENEAREKTLGYIQRHKEQSMKSECRSNFSNIKEKIVHKQNTIQHIFYYSYDISVFPWGRQKKQISYTEKNF